MNIPKPMGTGLTVLVVICAAAAGCAQVPTQDEHFGDSVRQMIRNQTDNPQAGDSVDRNATSLDGRKGEAVLEVYREDVAKPEDLPAQIQINVGK